MSDRDERFQRQTEWQRSRAKLSWTEKLAIAALLRDAAIALRAMPSSDKSTGQREPKQPIDD
jgi:hypothetical protein